MEMENIGIVCNGSKGSWIFLEFCIKNRITFICLIKYNVDWIYLKALLKCSFISVENLKKATDNLVVNERQFL